MLVRFGRLCQHRAMRIFLTGGSGFLGHHLVQKLVGEGHQVLALARSPESASSLQALGVVTITGDLRETSRWMHSLSGVDAVVHAAAPVEFWGAWQYFESQIVDATIALYRAANHAGVKQFIYISSEAVLQDARPLLDITEAEPYPAEPNSIYGRAKKLAEIRLRQSHFDTAITILRPSFIWGPGSPELYRIYDMVRKGHFVWIDQGRHPFERVHVNNVVAAILLALQRQRDGLYMVTDNEPGSVRDFFTPLLKAQGLTPTSRSLPSTMLRPVARGLEMVWQGLNFKQPPPLTRFDLAFLSQPRRYDISHIRRELGYEPVTSTATGIANLEGSFTP
jgi:nucleoside-diphosphate-sugar epimerase